MLITIIIILATIVNLALFILYRLPKSDNSDLLKLSAITVRNINDYADSLEAENSRLIAENRNLILRIDELESRLRVMKARQGLGLRAYEVGVNGLVFRHVRSVN